MPLARMRVRVYQSDNAVVLGPVLRVQRVCDLCGLRQRLLRRLRPKCSELSVPGRPAPYRPTSSVCM
jgi:hypothetical protein